MTSALPEDAPTVDLTSTTDRPMVSVVVPAFNEELIIRDSLAAIADELTRLEKRFRWEILVVDDGSTDATPTIVAEVAADEPRVRLLRHSVNFNIGQALRFAFRNCRGDYVVTMDADLSYDTGHIPRLLHALIAERAKMVVASPYASGGEVTGVPWRRRVLSRSANRFLSKVTPVDITTMTGLVRAYDRRFLDNLDLRLMDGSVNTEIVYKAHLLGARIVEIPAHLDWTGQEERNENRKGPKVTGLSKALLLAGIQFRPVQWFTGFGLVLFVVAAILGAIALAATIDELAGQGLSLSNLNQAMTDAFDRMPMVFLMSALTLLFASLVMALGVIAAVSRRYFHELFHASTPLMRRIEALEHQIRTKL